MSKVAFREVVSMRPTEPVFKEGALEKLLAPPPPPPSGEPPRSSRSSIQGGALIPAGATDFRSLDPVMQQHMQHQGRSIDQISSSVNNLQDTMSDLKHSFTSLRIELNGPTRYGGESNGPGFDMVATVLKELKSKSDEIEKLKLEIEALKLKARISEDSKPHTPEYMAGLEGALPRMQSPDLLQAGRKRGWADTFSGGNPLAIADTFEDDDMADDLSITGHLPLGGPHVPLRELAQNLSERRQSHSGAHTNSLSNNRETRGSQPAQSPAKRQRLGQIPDDSDFLPGKKRPGRPRKSTSQIDAPSKRSVSSGQAVSRGPGRPRRISDGATEQESENYAHPSGQDSTQNAVNGNANDLNIPQTPTATTHMDEDGPAENHNSVEFPVETSNENHTNGNGPTEIPSSSQITTEATNDTHVKGDLTVENQSSLQIPIQAPNESHTNGDKPASGTRRSRSVRGRGKRRPSIAARDAMVRKEMQREEAMETERAR